MNSIAQQEAIIALRQQLGSRLQSATEWMKKTGQNTKCTSKKVSNARFSACDLFDQLPCGQITEIRCPRISCGGGLAMAALITAARARGRYVVLIDVGRGFLAEDFSDHVLECLLWAGCDSLSDALSAFEIAANDENFDLFLLDARNCPATDWKGLPTARWQRILHALRRRSAAAVVFCHPASGPAVTTRIAKSRLEPSIRLHLSDLLRERSALDVSLSA